MNMPGETSTLAREIQARMTGITGPGDERAIVNLLATASTADLNAALATIDLDQLFSDLADRVVGPDHQSAALDLLCRDRLNELSLPVRARIVTAVQSGPTWAHHENHIRRLFLSSCGEELTRFKNLVNNQRSHYDIEKLLFDDIDDGQIRDDILAHIQREATPTGDIKILSDIDDTVLARLHDDRYPKGTVYPGVFAFLEELDYGPAGIADDNVDLTFLTARPGDALGVIERYTRNTLHDAGVPSFSVLSGALLNLRSKSAMASRKMGNFHRYQRLFPEYGFVFIGDSGQGDLLVGERMLAEAPDAMRGVFIHDVVSTPPETRAARRAQGIVLFDTYAGAALAAYAAGLVTSGGVWRVAQAAILGLAALEFASEDVRHAREAELARDVAEIRLVVGVPGSGRDGAGGE